MAPLKSPLSPGYRVRRYQKSSNLLKHPLRSNLALTPSRGGGGSGNEFSSSEWAAEAGDTPPLILESEDEHQHFAFTGKDVLKERGHEEDRREATETTPPKHIIIHTGNKLFWRINRTIDIRVYLSDEAGAVVVRSYDSVDNLEFEPIVVNLQEVLIQVKAIEVAEVALKESLAMHGSGRAADHGEDDVLKERREKKEAVRRRSLVVMKAVKTATTVDVKAEETAVEDRTKIASFIINRIEAIKDKVTGVISTQLTKRPADSYKDLGFDDGAPTGMEKCGGDICWNKKENEARIRRKSIEIIDGLQATTAATKLARQKQKAIQVYM